MAAGGDSGLPTTFSWRLGGDPRPSLFQAFPLGHAVRSAAMRAGNVIGLARLPDALHGGPGRREHDHAYWLSEDRDGDGLIDHVTVHANSGLPQAVVAALAGAGSVWLDRAATWELIPWTMGGPGAEGPLGCARIWHAATAYVTPLWRTTPGGRERVGLDAEAQLRGELAARGFPAPVRIIWRKRMRVPGAFRVSTETTNPTGARNAPGTCMGSRSSGRRSTGGPGSRCSSALWPLPVRRH